MQTLPPIRTDLCTQGHQGVKTFINPNKKGGRPPWATKRLKNSTLKSKPTNDGAWDLVDKIIHHGKMQ